MNPFFQAIWFALKHFFPRKIGAGLSVEDYSTRIIVQLWLARLFGGPALVLIGDSNSEAFSNQRDMIHLSPAGIVCGLGIGGTRGDQWAAFFQTDRGKLVLRLIGKARVVWNIGGNHVLQKQMGTVAQAYHDLHTLFPESFIVLIPPIHYSALSVLGLQEAETRANVGLVNAYARTIWGANRVIDLYDAFTDPKTGEAFPFVLADLVHYAPVARGVIVHAILEAVHD